MERCQHNTYLQKRGQKRLRKLYIHTYIHTLLQLPERAFQLQLQLSWYLTVICCWKDPLTYSIIQVEQTDLSLSDTGDPMWF